MVACKKVVLDGSKVKKDGWPFLTEAISLPLVTPHILPECSLLCPIVSTGDLLISSTPESWLLGEGA